MSSYDVIVIGAGPGGEITGFDAASGARFLREPMTQVRAIYDGLERRIYRGVDRRKQAQAPWLGVERRAGRKPQT